MKIQTVILTLTLSILALKSQNDQHMTTAVRTEGSLPSLRSAFRCVSDLDGKTYNKGQIKNCLDSIAALPYVQSVNPESNNLPNGNVFVEFVVQAKELGVQELTFGVPLDDEKPIRHWIAKNPNNLRIGGVYTANAETSTFQGIRQFYAAKGTLVGIVPTVRLNYNKGDAQIRFDIVEGPHVSPKPVYYPYAPTCDDEVHYLDWSQVDQFVPVPLMESLIKLRALGACFAPEQIKTDEKALADSGLFKKAAVTYSGPRGERRVALNVQGRTIRVRKIAVAYYGSNEHCETTDIEPELALKAGDTYTRPRAELSIEYIEKACSMPGQWIEVIESDERADDLDLKVTFNVLRFPLQSVFIDGKKVE